MFAGVGLVLAGAAPIDAAAYTATVASGTQVTGEVVSGGTQSVLGTVINETVVSNGTVNISYEFQR